jgi:hypothetical protein
MQVKIERVMWSGALLGVFVPQLAGAQVLFRENFNVLADGTTIRCAGPGGAGTYAFPADFLLRNVDNGTPAANVSYVNDAWEVREDFRLSAGNPGACAAFSTSWYTPAGVANDWMWTPPVALPVGGSASLRWRAVAYDASYPDGYEVRVMAAPSEPTGGAGAIGNQITNSSTVFAIAAENTAWTARSASLSAFAGQTVRVGFRNNSNNQFLLLIDDIEVINRVTDLEAVAVNRFASPYSLTPSGLVYPATLGVTANNSGTEALTQVSASAQLLVGATPVGPPLVSNTLAGLAPIASAPLQFSGSAVYEGLGAWSIEYRLSAAEAANELNTQNNIVRALGPVTGGLELARYEAESALTSLGIGAGNGGELGVRIDLPQAYTFRALRFLMSPPPNASNWLQLTLTAHLRSFDTATGRPGAIIASATQIPTPAEPSVIDAAFDQGEIALPAGSYVVSVTEPVGLVADDGTGSAMQLGMRVDRFQPSHVFVNWPTSPSGGWAPVESFGGNFARMPQIGLLSAEGLFAHGFEGSAAPPMGRHVVRPYTSSGEATQAGVLSEISERERPAATRRSD